MSYQMIIVDDEVHAVEGVKADLDLRSLGISRLFTAYNVKQAKEVFDREHIDFMLCDIEMPRGSGLELLEWVRLHHPHTVTVFLTSHADFRYAKEAIRLGSLDYLLKPVLAEELAGVIRRALQVVDQHLEMRLSSQYQQLWMKNQSLIVERFWLDIISHRVMAHPTAIREYADMRNIPITDDMEFLPVLLSVQRWHRDLTGRDEKILEYALMKSAEEMILADHHNGMFFYLDDGRFIGIIAGNKGDQWDLESLTAASHRYISSCNQYFYCDLSCYWGMPVQPHMMSSMVEKLRTQDNNNVAFFNQVYLYCEDGNMHQQVQLPDLDIWTNLLKTEDRNEIIVSVEKLFDRLTSSGHLNADLLHKIQQDYLQALYSYLNQKGIQAHQLFGDEMSKRVAAAANRSVADMLSWVKYSVERAINQSEVVDKAFTLVETVKQYIARNIDRDLSRELIASIAYLNPDHLSRIFKKHTGYAISEYVLMERVKLAKKLLVTTDIPIGAIATSVGYSNFSHFARMFKKYAEMGPSEYRQKYKMEGVKINASFHKTIDQ